MAFTGPNAITKSGTVVFGPSLSTPVPLGQVISVMIYRGINAPYAASRLRRRADDIGRRELSMTTIPLT